MSMRNLLKDRVALASSDIELDADVLVIGGSLAGAWAALTARRHGATVVLAEKGYVGTAGPAAPANVGGYYIDPSATRGQSKVVLARHAAAQGLDDLEHVERVYRQSHAVYQALERMGFRYDSRPNGNAQMGRFIGNYTLDFLRRALVQAGVKILDHSPALELLSHEGEVSGARGVARQSNTTWTVRARSVILATGGTSFLSGAMGTRGLTADGHLMAAEAGAQLVSQEFSTLYGYAPLHCPSTKGFWYEYATFFDGHQREMDHPPGRGAMTHVARSILDTGGAYAVINKVPPGFESHARLNHAVAFLFFDRHGLNPFKDRWPLQMLLEGHMRGVGGLAIADDTSTGVPGLFAAGDVTDRTRLVGAGMSGGGPAVAWCFASGEWAGEAASRHARERSAASASCVALHALGTCGLRPLRTGGSRLDTTLVRDGVRAEVLPLEKHFFRTGAGMQASQGILDALWTQSRAALGGTDARSVLAAREAAALLASARWMLASAQQRTESRGLHRHGDYPQQDARQSHHLLSGGLDDVWVRQRALPGSTSGPVNASRSDRVEFA